MAQPVSGSSLITSKTIKLVDLEPFVARPLPTGVKLPDNSNVLNKRNAALCLFWLIRNQQGCVVVQTEEIVSSFDEVNFFFSEFR